MSLQAPGKTAQEPDVGPRSEELRDVERRIDRLTFEAGRAEPSPAPLAAPLGFRRVLVGLDGTPTDASTLAWAREVARSMGAEVRVVHVAPTQDMRSYQLDLLSAYWPGTEGIALTEDLERSAHATVERAAAGLRAAGLEVEAEVAHGQPGRELVRIAGSAGADLVVVGDHRRGAAERLLLGSVASAVKDHAAASVLIARGLPPAERLLLPTDGSSNSKRAVAVGLRLSRLWNAPARVLHVLPPPALTAPPTPGARLAQGVLGTVDLTWNMPHATLALEAGEPAERIVEVAKRERTGLIVLGCRGLSGLRSLVAGSVSDRVAHTARCAVLIVKEAVP